LDKVFKAFRAASSTAATWPLTFTFVPDLGDLAFGVDTSTVVRSTPI
jgi:hypothetical protein